MSLYGMMIMMSMGGRWARGSGGRPSVVAAAMAMMTSVSLDRMVIMVMSTGWGDGMGARSSHGCPCIISVLVIRAMITMATMTAESLGMIS